MKEAEFKKIVEKYKEGDSSLDEEKLLFNHADFSDEGLDAWSAYVNGNKTETPKDFNETLWESFQNKKTRKRRVFAKIASVAASVVLLISLFIGNIGEKELSNSEKEISLYEALEMFPETEPNEIQQIVFYEDEVITIYTIIE